jgi:hypothetical protein
VTNRLIRGREDSATSKTSPKLSDGTGREPAVAEMSRSVPARTAISIALGLPLLLLSLNLQAVRTNIDLEALWLLAILIEIVTEHSDHDDQCSDDQKQRVSIAEHGYPSSIMTAPFRAVACHFDRPEGWTVAGKLLIFSRMNRVVADQPELVA